MSDRILTSSIEVRVARMKRACMWMHEHVYVSACVGAKNTVLVSVCLCIHQLVRLPVYIYLNRSDSVGAKADRMSFCVYIYPSIRLFAHMYLNIDVCMFLSACLPNVCLNIRPSIYPSACMIVYVKVCVSIPLFFCPSVCMNL